ncbi:uroporphyrinogen-III C-methyltransferase [Acidiphilium sp. C61]|uniref:uroporphyrinogen-III C-methyltransferase n=1 Tax=Acidiphilium sp. C61 TaxID=1671485 RepID=UPI00157AD29D|nr:uroporphyrinogen-III C-methyltransferase [Acidiphilium sp. C61]
MIRHPAFAPGSVWLAGAGPGDPALLTLAALHAIETADVILHDALVPAEILALAPAATRLVPAGKRAGGIHTPQLSINEDLIALARQGLRVLRLKGGDPFIFGRGGEECLALAAASIPFRVIPGISAGIGAASAAHMPITHRGVARSVVFATGEAGPAGGEVDFAALGRAADTLVLYMARQNIGRIAAALIAGGRSPTDPLAFLLDATTPRERVVHTTIGAAAAIAATLPPAATLVIVGPVAGIGAMIAPHRPEAEPSIRSAQG